MSLELDWLEREERYRQRVTRLLTVAVILVAALLGTGFYLRSRHVKSMREAAARAAQEQQRERVRRQREQFAADSTAAADRYKSFKEDYRTEPLEGLPLLAVPLPSGQPVRSFLERAWADYVQVIDPNATSDESITWFRQNYTDVMNDGPLRGRAILLPKLEQKGTMLEIEKSTFTQITRAQIEVGMREEIEAPTDSLGLDATGSMAAGSETTGTPADDASSSSSTDDVDAAPESTETAPAPESSEPTPPATTGTANASTPATPVPPETAPQESLPASSAPPDSVPNP